MKLNEKAMLVSLVLKKWSPRKVDKRLAGELTDKYGIDPRVVSASKKLVAINEGSFKSIETLDKKIRNHVFYSVGTGCKGFCVPYDGKGKHLLPTELHDKFVARFNDYADKRERKVKQIVEDWDTIIESAKEELKGVFTPNDYPSKEELANLYECRYVIESLPEEAYVGRGDDQKLDPRFGVSGAETLEVQVRERSTIEEATEQATTNMVVLLTHLADCLKEDKTFRDNSFTKVKDAIDQFDSWNFNDNEKLYEVSTNLKEAIADIDGASDLRKDKGKADKLVKASDEANDILDKLEGII